jgi:GAF domain-containing protein
MTKKRTAQAYMNALRESAHILSGVLKEPEAIQILLQQITTFLSAQGAAVLLLSSSGDELLVAGSFGIQEACLGACPIRVADSEIDRHVLDGEVILLSDVAGMLKAKDPLVIKRSCKSMIAVPLTVRGHTIGIIRVYVKDIESKDSEDVALLVALGDLGALALEKVRLHQSLYHIAEALSSIQDSTAMLERVLKATVEEMWLKAASIRLLDSKRKTLSLIASYGLSEAYRGKGEVHLDKSPIDQRVLRGEAVVLYDVGRELGYEYPEKAVQEGLLSILAAPLKLKERPFGVMRVYSAQPRHFSSVAVTFLESVADLVSIALENAQLYASLQEYNKNLKEELTDWRHFLALG